MSVSLPEGMKRTNWDEIGRLSCLTAGTYLVETIKRTLATVQVRDDKGVERLRYVYRLQLEVQEPPFDGRRIFDTIWLTDESLWRMRDYAVVCGVDPKQYEDDKERLMEACDHCQFKVTVDQKQGKDGNWRNTVTKFHLPSYLAPEPDFLETEQSNVPQEPAEAEAPKEKKGRFFDKTTKPNG